MDDSKPVSFRVGDFDVTLEIYNGEVVGSSATGPDEGSYLVDFAFRNNLTEGFGCKICRLVHGHYLCEDIQCNVLVGAPDAEQY